jgi:hypothetical protein
LEIPTTLLKTLSFTVSVKKLTPRQFFNNPGFRLKGLEFLTHLNGKKSGELDRTMQRTISETQFITYINP